MKESSPCAVACCWWTPPVPGPRDGSSGLKTVLTPCATSLHGDALCYTHLPRQVAEASKHPLWWGSGWVIRSEDRTNTSCHELTTGMPSTVPGSLR